jgi:hypothetical protein
MSPSIEAIAVAPIPVANIVLENCNIKLLNAWSYDHGARKLREPCQFF